MAYKSLARPTSILKYCYNLTMAVGQNKPNNPDDVMLVQLCLQQIFRDPTLCPAAPKDYTVVPDGKYGPITRNAIWIFQSYLQRVGGMVYPDGVIDRASDLRVTARDTDHIYTILWLNRYLEFAIGKERFDNLENERITPHLLALRLAVNDI